MKALILLLSILLTSVSLNSQSDTLLPMGIQKDIFLHPADGFTAYSLKKNELIYNQSPFTLPFPSWAWWGITDRLTAEIDLLPLLGGLFQPPNLPVPSFNFRYRLVDQKGILPTIAFETMYQHLWRTQNQADQRNLRIERQGGNSWYNRFNLSWYNQRKLYFHLSIGMTYTENLLIENKDTLNHQGAFFSRTINPDCSLSLDWRTLPWLSVHTSISYGTTFTYLDNIPRKYQLAYGFRLAPFHSSKKKFFSSLRAEFIGFYMYFPDAQSSIASILPVFPYFYWQWTLK